MTTYRVFRMTEEGHIVGPSIVLACDSEQDAVDRATELAGETAVELWDGSHMVCRIPSSKI
jgi:hypothetical protein